MVKKGLIILIGLALLIFTSAAEEFRFKYNYGEKYKLVTRVNENVYINGSFSHQAEILNKISVEVVGRQTVAVHWPEYLMILHCGLLIF